MKKLIIFLFCIVMLIPSIKINAANRVIYSFEEITNNQGEITLFYYDKTLKNDIRVTSYQILEENLLQVEYEINAKIPNSNKMKIILPEQNFPMKIILKEQRNNLEKLSDLPKDIDLKTDIINLYDKGILSGYPDGSFKPEKEVSRAEFAKIVVATAGYELQQNSETLFIDVSNNHWAKDYINTLAEKGILLGKGNNKFDPNANITIGEILTVLNRTFNVFQEDNSIKVDITSHWSKDAYYDLLKKQIAIEKDSFTMPYTPDIKGTRQQCATLLSRILLKYYIVK